MTIDLKRVYDPPANSDGRRILVDRIWPRGITKADLQIDAWLKDLAPSTELRKWFGHDPAKWDEFRKRYAGELEQRSEALEELVEKARAGRVTLVFSAKDTEHNNAVALKAHLERRLKRRADAERCDLSMPPAEASMLRPCKARADVPASICRIAPSDRRTVRAGGRQGVASFSRQSKPSVPISSNCCRLIARRGSA